MVPPAFNEQTETPRPPTRPREDSARGPPTGPRIKRKAYYGFSLQRRRRDMTARYEHLRWDQVELSDSLFIYYLAVACAHLHASKCKEVPGPGSCSSTDVEHSTDSAVLRQCHTRSSTRLSRPSRVVALGQLMKCNLVNQSLWLNLSLACRPPPRRRPPARARPCTSTEGCSCWGSKGSRSRAAPG